ncbi:MAG: META domain-containing protein [Actinomycetota bacterium]
MLHARPGPSPNRHRPWRFAIGLVAVSLLLVGCGADELDDGPDTVFDGPRVAHPRFDGRFEIVELDGADGRTALRQSPSLTIDARFGRLEVDPGCNTYLGSFTLDEDGRASFTITGGTGFDCEDLADQELAVLDALDGVDAWSEDGDGFRFDGSAATVRIAGPAG